MPSYAFEGLKPVVSPGAFVHPDAVLIGDVVIADGCFIGPCASLRGDFGRIVISSGSNVQDNCTVHSFPGRTVVVEQEGHVGHGAILHGCTIGRNALIGMNAVIMDNAEIGPDAIIGGGSFVKAGTKVPAGTLWAGLPAREIRSITADDQAWKTEGTRMYQQLAHRYMASCMPCEPLDAEETDRPRLAGDYLPLDEWRASRNAEGSPGKEAMGGTPTQVLNDEPDGENSGSGL